VDDAVVRALRAALAGRADVRLAILFGSTARGTAGPSSDVDVAVLARASDALALARDLTRAVGREVQIVDLESVGYPTSSPRSSRSLPIASDVSGSRAATPDEDFSCCR
jgi:predicted nucleotidyltransferase